MSYIGTPPFGQTVRTISEKVAVQDQVDFYPDGGYLPGYIDIIVNGQELLTTDVTALDGVKVTLKNKRGALDEVRMIAYWPVSLVDTYRKSEAVAKAGDTLTGALNMAADVTLASASSVAIGAAASNGVTITGTTAITSFDAIAAGAVRRVTFSGALTLTHNATSLILPSGANITTAAGDVAEFVSLGSGNWRCINYMKANGQSVVGGKFDYVSSVYPAYNTNPLIPYATWYNTTSKSVLYCVDNTTNANIWREITTVGNATRFDFFGDGSAVAFYPLDGGSGTDVGGLYSMITNGFSSGGAGKFNTCAYGNPAYMASGSVAGGTAPNNSSVVTVSLWINSACSGDNYIWSSGKLSNGTNKRGLLLTGTTIKSDYTSEYGALPSLTITPNTWTHICVSGNKVYKNGALIGTMASYSGPSSDTYGFYIGANGAYDYGYVGNETYGKPMNGYLDQVRIFNRVLSDAEVNALYLETV